MNFGTLGALGKVNEEERTGTRVGRVRKQMRNGIGRESLQYWRAKPRWVNAT